MSDSIPNIKSAVIRIITNKPVRKTPYQVKGVLMRHYPDQKIIPMLNGSLRDRFLYPRAQVKILNEQIYLIGIHEGVDPVLSLYDSLKELNFGNITFEIEDCDVETYDNQFIPSNEIINYRFITSWVALNKITGAKYKSLEDKEKASYLNKLLGQNIIFLANELGIKFEEDILTKVKVSSFAPEDIDENKWGSFSGNFSTNFILPSFTGIGNGITRGYGTIYRQINKDAIVYGSEKQNDEESDEKLKSSEEFEITSYSDVPKPRRKKSVRKKRRKYHSKNKNQKNYKKNRNNKKANVYNNNSDKKNKKHYKRKYKSGNFLSEDYDIEENSKNSEHNDDYKFNTEKHHKKQHKF